MKPRSSRPDRRIDSPSTLLLSARRNERPTAPAVTGGVNAVTVQRQDPGICAATQGGIPPGEVKELARAARRLAPEHAVAHAPLGGARPVGLALLVAPGLVVHPGSVSSPALRGGREGEPHASASPFACHRASPLLPAGLLPSMRRDRRQTEPRSVLVLSRSVARSGDSEGARWRHISASLEVNAPTYSKASRWASSRSRGPTRNDPAPAAIRAVRRRPTRVSRDHTMARTFRISGGDSSTPGQRLVRHRRAFSHSMPRRAAHSGRRTATPKVVFTVPDGVKLPDEAKPDPSGTTWKRCCASLLG